MILFSEKFVIIYFLFKKLQIEKVPLFLFIMIHSSKEQIQKLSKNFLLKNNLYTLKTQCAEKQNQKFNSHLFV